MRALFLLDEEAHPWRVPALDGVRGVAAIMVLVAHLYAYSDVSVPAVGTLLHYAGQAGVVLFFVLSGFLLYIPWVRARAESTNGPRLRTFAKRRVLRIVPAYYFCFLTIATISTIQGAALSPVTLVLHAAFLPLFSPDALLSVFWSLQVEWYFYAILPVLAYGFLHVPLRVGVAACGAVSVAFGAGAVLFVGPTHLGAVIQSMPFYLFAFACGMAAADRWSGDRGASASPQMLIAIPVAYVIVSQIAAWGQYDTTTVAFANLALAPAAAALVLITARGTFRGFAVLPLRVVGSVSFSLYLWHLYLIKELPLDMAVLLVAPVTLVSFFLIERPFLQKKDRSRAAAVNHDVPTLDLPVSPRG